VAASNKRVRLGIIGCGAIVEFFYLPVASKLQELEVVALVDKNVDRAQNLAKRFNIGVHVDDYRRVPKDLDGVLIALPHNLHAPVAIEFLSEGIPVLVEKPLAMTVEEARRVIDVAHAKGTMLQVAQKFRFCNQARLVKRAIDEGWLGRLRGFEIAANFEDKNPMASGFCWSKEQAGGGILVDVGSLILDTLLWWLGDPVEVEYCDDSLGGVESDCELSLVLMTPHGPVAGRVILSRLRKRKDVARIDGERLSIVYGLESMMGQLYLLSAATGERLPFVSDSQTIPQQSWRDIFREQLRSFATAITTGGVSPVPGESALSTLALIESCYRVRRPLKLPWETGEDLVRAHI